MVKEIFLSDREAIVDLINRWAYFRDRGMWDQLKSTFWGEGTISFCWFDGPFEQFVDAIRKIDEQGESTLSKHFVGTPFVRINDCRAVSEVNAMIFIRIFTRNIDMDMTSYIRFYDLLEKRNGSWRIVRRTAIYEKDRVDSVQPSFLFWFVSLFINVRKYPKPYRYLGYGMEKIGYKIVNNIVEDNSEGLKLLYRAGDAWLLNKDVK